MSEDWLVAMAQPMRQSRALRDLESLGVSIFRPRQRLVLFCRGRKSTREVPLFGRYFFVEYCKEWQRLLVRNLDGFLMSSDSHHPSVVSDREVSKIRSSCDENGVLIELNQKSSSKLQRGQKVRPKSGALMDLCGIYSGREKNREDALFILLGRQVKTSFVAGTLIAA